MISHYAAYLRSKKKFELSWAPEPRYLNFKK